MIIELKIPELGESINEVQVGAWLKKVGAWVDKDEPVVEIESEKATVEIPAPEAGVVSEHMLAEGDIAAPGAVVGSLDTEAAASVPNENAEPEAMQPPVAPEPKTAASDPRPATPSTPGEVRVMPAAARLMADAGLAIEDVTPSGPGGRLLKEDVQLALRTRTGKPAVSRAEHTKRMGLLRKTIAARLLEAQQTAALLTTFNEVDMSAVVALRREAGERFKEQHGVKLGFMSFFVKAVTAALKEHPTVGAQVRGDEIVTFDYCDIGIAVGGGKGLVVPVIRNAEIMGFADIERKIAELAGRAQASKLSMEELSGGTFTISNGGIYGSMLSTPIVNPPQSGILGLHAIEDRPVARDGQVVIRPMMFLALTYDHRIIDGREAVTFLKGIKHRVENPARLMMELLEE